MTTTPTDIVSRAIAHMEEHLAGPLTVQQISAAVQVGVRTMQLAFRNQLGTSPMAWLRHRRLTVAYDRLAAATTGSTTVTEIAAGIGISHFGRFAVEYQRRFGIKPSQSLAQTAISTSRGDLYVRT